jgi:hypothetical protein
MAEVGRLLIPICAEFEIWLDAEPAIMDFAKSELGRGLIVVRRHQKILACALEILFHADAVEENHARESPGFVQALTPGLFQPEQGLGRIALDLRRRGENRLGRGRSHFLIPSGALPFFVEPRCRRAMQENPSQAQLRFGMAAFRCELVPFRRAGGIAMNGAVTVLIDIGKPEGGFDIADVDAPLPQAERRVELAPLESALGAGAQPVFARAVDPGKDRPHESVRYPFHGSRIDSPQPRCPPPNR